jgi:hypothetical protein
VSKRIPHRQFLRSLLCSKRLLRSSGGGGSTGGSDSRSFRTSRSFLFGSLLLGLMIAQTIRRDGRNMGAEKSRKL